MKKMSSLSSDVSLLTVGGVTILISEGNNLFRKKIGRPTESRADAPILSANFASASKNGANEKDQQNAIGFNGLMGRKENKGKEQRAWGLNK